MKKEPFFGISLSFGESKPTTVDGVLEAFHTAIANLEDVAKAHEAKADDHDRIIEEHMAHKMAAEAEAVRASGIVQRMKAIFQ